MKKFLGLFFLVSLLVVFAGPYVPYWVLMIGVATISFLFGSGNFSSFLSCGLSFGLTWLGLGLYISIKTGSDLPQRMSELMGLENESFILIGTGLLGFIIGSLSGLTGAMFKGLFQRKNHQSLSS